MSHKMTAFQKFSLYDTNMTCATSPAIGILQPSKLIMWKIKNNRSQVHRNMCKKFESSEKGRVRQYCFSKMYSRTSGIITWSEKLRKGISTARNNHRLSSLWKQVKRQSSILIRFLLNLGFLIKSTLEKKNIFFEPAS